MKVGISPDEWRTWLREPIARGLLASLSLHFAFVTLFQSSPPASSAQVVVINARLQPEAPANQSERVEAVEPPQLVEPVVADAEPVLAVLTPSVVPPMVAPVAEEPPDPAVPSPPAVVLSTQSNTSTAVTVSNVAAVTAVTAPAVSAAAEPQTSSPAQTGHREVSSLPSLPLGIDTNWYQARQVDKHPKAIGKVEPVYPEAAKRGDIQGTLKLKLRIDDLGRVQDAEVVEASPPGVFDEAALTAFRKARFQPAIKDGRPVRYEAYIRVEFELKD